MAQKEKDESDSLSANIPGFGNMKASGPQVMVSIVIILCFLGIGYLVIKHEEASAQARILLTTQQMEIKDTMTEVTYILSLSAEQRSALKLDMPNSLRKKVKN